jgi:adenine deaminase
LKRSKLSEIAPFLVEVALGKRKADLLIRNATLVNVYSKEIVDDVDIAVFRDRVAYVGNDGGHALGNKTIILDVANRFVAPGLIDAHAHIAESYATPTELTKQAALYGTTTIISEVISLVNVLGLDGFKLFLDEVSRLPIRVYSLVPLAAPQDPSFETTRSLSQEEVTKILKLDDVVGLGEAVSWPRILEGDPEYFRKFASAYALKKRVEGHLAGAKERKLVASIASGISSCHESISFAEVIARLSLGLYVMLREGSIRRELINIVPQLSQGKNDSRRIILVSDSLDPSDLVTFGYMDHILRRAIELGLDPVEAVQMVTLNPSEHFALSDDIGGIAPSKFADMVVLDDLKRVKIWMTLCGGKIVSKEGKIIPQIPRYIYPPSTLNTMRVSKELSASDFAVKVPNKKISHGKVKALCAKIENETITKQMLVELPVRENGVLKLEDDVWKVSVFDRYWASGQSAAGLIKGFGVQVGAIATTFNFDEYNLLVAGGSDFDMAIAANEVIQSKGGIAVVDHQEILLSLPMKLAGVISVEPFKQLEKKYRHLNELLRRCGSPFEKPLNPLVFLTFVTLPEIRFTHRGIVDVKKRAFTKLFS